MYEIREKLLLPALDSFKGNRQSKFTLMLFIREHGLMKYFVICVWIYVCAFAYIYAYITYKLQSVDFDPLGKLKKHACQQIKLIDA